MNFIKQVKAELVNLMKMRFILVLGIIVLIMGFAGPVIDALTGKNDESYDGNVEMISSYYGGSEVPLNIDGIEIDMENPFYYDVLNYSGEYAIWMAEDPSISQASRDVTDEIASIYLEYYLEYASMITSYEDYRIDLVWRAMALVPEIYVLEASPEDEEEFRYGVELITYVEDIEELLDLPEEEKEVLLEEKRVFLEKANNAILNDVFGDYADCMIEVSYNEIEEYQEMIAIQEAAVIENPDLEESVESEIKRLQSQIVQVEESTIPTWEYRKERNLYPNLDDWRNEALSQIEYGNYRLNDSENLMKEEEFSADMYLVQMYGSYDGYVKGMKLQKIEAQSEILVGQKSLDSDEPDMKFVSNGARNKVNGNLSYSLIVSVLGVLIGGYLIANEFQSGTVRLLMIRPRRRGKVYAAKYLAGLIYVYAIYLIGMLCNIIANGAISGFADYGFPNYSASGSINFWGMIIVRILVCSVTIVFSYSVAYSLSSIIKNAAIAIILPSAGIFGGMIAALIFAYSNYAEFLTYTPLPYLNFSNFYSEYGLVEAFASRGINLQVSIGVVMLSVIAIVFYFLGFVLFKKHDITN